MIRAIDLDVNYEKAYVQRGLLSGRMQMYSAATDDLTRAIALDATDAEAYLGRANIYATLNDSVKARGDYAQYLQWTPPYDKNADSVRILIRKLGGQPAM